MLAIDSCTTCVGMICRAFPSAPQNLFCDSLLSLAVPAGMAPFQATQLWGGFVVFCIAVLRNLTSVVQTALCFCGWWCYVLLLHVFVCLELLWQKFRWD